MCVVCSRSSPGTAKSGSQNAKGVFEKIKHVSFLDNLEDGYVVEVFDIPRHAGHRGYLDNASLGRQK